MKIAYNAEPKTYAHFDLAKPNASGKWEIDFVNLTAFFVVRGYGVYRTSVDRWILIHVQDNIVKQVGKKDLKDVVLKYIVEEEADTRFLHQFFLKNIAKVCNDEFLETLPEKKVIFRRDRKDAMQLYYLNCIVKITTAKVTVHDYTALDGFIWESQIIQREYEPKEVKQTADFARFIFNICAKDKERARSICSAMGYHLHNYKPPGCAPVTVLNDEVISDNPEGGTGKGIIFTAISKFVNTVILDGKTFSFDKNFLYQRITKETKLILFQDVKKDFDFERLFSIITDGMVTEKKGKDEQFLSYEESPKIGITTNYALKGIGNSHGRRRNELEISQYYNKKNRPEIEFGRYMFNEWDTDEWLQFDNYMIRCCQTYLTSGLVEQPLINLPEKRLMAETNSHFLRFIREKELLKDGMYIKKELVAEFLEDNADFAKSKWFTINLFSKWLTAYAHSLDINVIDKRDSSGKNRCYYFVKMDIEDLVDKYA